MPIRSYRLAGAMLLIAAACLPAMAQAQYHTPPGYTGRSYDRGPGWRGRGDYDRDGRAYDRGNYPNRCDRGTGGTIIGAIAGGLLGNAVVGRGDRTIGTVAGAGAGALAGRAIDRDC